MLVNRLLVAAFAVAAILGVVAEAPAPAQAVAVPPAVCTLNPGTACAWGADSNGQLGNGFDVEYDEPDQVDGLANIVAVSAGGSHTLALISNGTVYAWGRDAFSELGNGPGDSPQNSPVAVSGLGKAIAVAAGEGHSLVLLADGTLRSWGANDYGQVGNNNLGTNADGLSP